MKVMNESCIKVYNKKQQKILKQMNKNSKKWHDTDNRFEKDLLHQANIELAEKLGGTVQYNSYNGTWSGNAAHIDLEAWECPLCESNKVISYRAWEDEEAYNEGETFIQGGAMFCPYCGKLRTPEARAMLEKRLRGVREVKCKFEHDEDCCNSGSPQYMCKCEPSACNSAAPMTNADRIRAMSDEELASFFAKIGGDKAGGTARFYLEWLGAPAKED